MSNDVPERPQNVPPNQSVPPNRPASPAPQTRPIPRGQATPSAHGAHPTEGKKGGVLPLVLGALLALALLAAALWFFLGQGDDEETTVTPKPAPPAASSSVGTAPASQAKPATVRLAVPAGWRETPVKTECAPAEKWMPCFGMRPTDAEKLDNTVVWVMPKGTNDPVEPTSKQWDSYISRLNGTYKAAGGSAVRGKDLDYQGTKVLTFTQVVKGKDGKERTSAVGQVIRDGAAYRVFSTVGGNKPADAERALAEQIKTLEIK